MGQNYSKGRQNKIFKSDGSKVLVAFEKGKGQWGVEQLIGKEWNENIMDIDTVNVIASAWFIQNKECSFSVKHNGKLSEVFVGEHHGPVCVF